MANSRRVVRSRSRFPVTVGGKASFTVNIGSGGFCTEMLRVLPQGTLVDGRIRVHQREHEYAGRVVWSRPGSPWMNVRGRMGIKFLSIAPDFLRVLEALHPVDPPAGALENPGASKKP